MFRSILILSLLYFLGVAVQARPTTQCIGKAADIMFVLDSSSSIWIVDYKKQLNFVAELVDSFNVGNGRSQVRIGAITFSDRAYLEFPLGRYNDPVELKKAILNISYRQGRTNTADALRLLKEQIKPNLNSNKGPIVAVVITDGRSTSRVDTLKEAEKLHELGINVYAIGVGNANNYDMGELKAIASDPEHGVYTVSSYSALKEITQKFHIQPCEETTTPETTTTTTTTTTSTEAPTTTRAPTTTSPVPDPTVPVEKPVQMEPDNQKPSQHSIILFGYDLVAMGTYRSGMIHQFINTMLPYMGHEHYGIVSYGYCPSNFNVPITSLINKDSSDIKNSVPADTKLPDLVDVVRQMRNVLYTRSIQNANSGHIENQAAILFVDPSITTITPELSKEIEMLKKNGVKISLINVGTCSWPQPGHLHSMSSQPYHRHIFNAPSYHQLLLTAQHNPAHFRPLFNHYVPTAY